MGRRGPKPTPTKVLRAAGSWLAKTRPDEPDATAGIPDPPEYLNDGARRHWMRLVPMLRDTGLLGLEYRDALGDLCHALDQRDRIAVVMNEIFDTDRVSSDAPELADTFRELRKLSDAVFGRCAKGYALFGMSPADRARVTSGKANGKADSKDKSRFFRAG